MQPRKARQLQQQVRRSINRRAARLQSGKRERQGLANPVPPALPRLQARLPRPRRHQEATTSFWGCQAGPAPPTSSAPTAADWWRRTQTREATRQPSRPCKQPSPCCQTPRSAWCTTNGWSVQQGAAQAAAAVAARSGRWCTGRRRAGRRNASSGLAAHCSGTRALYSRTAAAAASCRRQQQRFRSCRPAAEAAAGGPPLRLRTCGEWRCTGRQGRCTTLCLMQRRR